MTLVTEMSRNDVDSYDDDDDDPEPDDAAFFLGGGAATRNDFIYRSAHFHLE